MARPTLSAVQGWCDTPVGQVIVTWSAAGVSSVRRADDAVERGVIEPLPSDLAASIERRLKTGEASNLEFDLSACSPLERDVLTALQQIPFGEVRSYSWLAVQIGRPRAGRAVASAVGRNPIPLLFPCHRVVRADGLIGEFGWGPEMKLALLRHEGAPVDGGKWF
jgi:O-6-methylguanine DNA methyltransferase